MKWLICLAGGIASGKTTLAGALQASLPGSVRVAFGDVVRRRAMATSPSPSRQALQDAGLHLIQEGWPAFVSALLADIGDEPDLLIVEGVRHQEAVDALRRRLPTHDLLLVYADVPDDLRRQRLDQLGEHQESLSHAVERDVESLRGVADLVVDTRNPASELAALICQHMRTSS